MHSNMKGQKYLQKYFIILIVCYSLLGVSSSCNQADENKKVDISNIPVHFKPIRFDKILFAFDTNKVEQEVNQLGSAHPDFAQIYFNEITGFAQTQDQSKFIGAVRHFLTYKDYVGLKDTVLKHFPETKEIDHSLKDLFAHIKYYYPTQHWGTVYYFISGLNNWSAVTVDSIVGVGLDMYLGKDYPFYQSIQLPQYLVDRCEKNYIPINVSRVIYEDMHPFNAEGKTLLDLMIMRGKEVLFTEYTLPNENIETLLGYTPKQLKWCNDNEAMIWNYFTKSKLLYSTQWQEILRYVNDGPNTTGMPPESPGNIGSWLGWRIAKKYLEKNPTIKWKDLVESNTSAQQILTKADYRPR